VVGAQLDQSRVGRRSCSKAQPYSVGLVIDPVRNEEACFIGPDSLRCRFPGPGMPHTNDRKLEAEGDTGTPIAGGRQESSEPYQRSSLRDRRRTKKLQAPFCHFALVICDLEDEGGARGRIARAGSSSAHHLNR
jgi:hypothetical protein